MSQVPLVSVIIPIYNVAKWLPQCLESCLNQTYRNIEILAINDGSTDNSKQIIERHVLLDDRIKLIDKYNGGSNSAREAGIDYAKGDYITILDGDDFLENDAIYKMIKIAKENDADIVVAGANIVVAENKKIINHIKHPLLTLEGLGYVKYTLKNGPNTVCMKLYKNKIIKINTEYPNFPAGEDLPLTIQWGLRANTVIFTTEIVYNYVVARQGSIMSGHRQKYVEGAFQAYFFTFMLLAKESSLQIEVANLVCSQLYSYLYDHQNNYFKNKNKIYVMGDYIYINRKYLIGKQFLVLSYLIKINIQLAHLFVAIMQKIKPTLNPYTK